MRNGTYANGLLYMFSHDVTTEDLEAYLVDDVYEADFMNHVTLSDVSGIFAGPAEIPDVVAVGGNLFAGPAVFEDVPTPNVVSRVLVVASTGPTDKDKRLLAAMDRRQDTRLINVPATGGDITVTWSTYGILNI